MICSNCKKENPDGSKFCSYCGQVMDNRVNMQVQSTTSLQVVANNTNKTSFEFSKGQKITIIVLLLGVILSLSMLLIFGNKKQEVKEKDPTRTIMIYLDGSNLESDSGIVTAELEALDTSKIDLEKTNVLIYTGGTEKWLNSYISNEENAIFKLTSDGFEKIKTYDKLNMGDPDTLSDFINYTYDNYKAGHYNLIIYDHGGALDGAVYDDFTDDNLSLADFKEAMKDSPFNEDNKLDAVLFRTCLNGTLEVASIFEPYSEYIVFSEEVSYGNETSDVFSFINNLDETDEGDQFGIKFIDQYKVQMDTIDPLGMNGVTYSVVDLSKLGKVYDELDKFIKGVDIKENYNNISRVRANMYQYASSSSALYYDTVDLYSLINDLKDYSSASSEALLNAVKDAVVDNYTNIDSSNGISIYFPYNGRNYRKKFLSVYSDLTFSDNYKQFITSFYNAQSSASSFSYDFSKNKSEVTSNGKEVSFELTEDQVKNYAKCTYTLFLRDAKHPNYYRVVYNSNNATLDGNKLTTNMDGKLISVSTDDGSREFIPVYERDKDGVDNIYTTAIFYDKSKDIQDKKRSFNATALFNVKDGKVTLASAKVSSADDERVIGSLLDLNSYNYVEIYFHEYKILDKNGKFTWDWESAPEIYGVGDELKNFDFKSDSIGTGEFYVLFSIADVNNEEYHSELIKVGE